MSRLARSHPSSTKRQKEPRPSRLATASKWLGVLVIGGILGHVIDDAYAWLKNEIAGNQSIPLQIEHEISEAAQDGLRVVDQRDVDFSGVGRVSHVIVFRAFGAAEYESQIVSDEIRIYEDADGSLVERFAWRAKTNGGAVQGFTWEPPSLFPMGLAAVFPELSPGSPVLIAIDLVHDIDGDGGDEVIVRLPFLGMAPVNPHPAVVDWNPKTGTFTIQPLLRPVRAESAVPYESSKPRLITRFVRPGDYAWYAIRGYRTPDRFVSTDGSTSFLSFGAEDCLAVAEEQATFLICGYLIHGAAHYQVDLLQVIAWKMYLDPEAFTTEVTSGPGSKRWTAPIEGSVRQTLAVTWRRIRRQTPAYWFERG
jgi:hypothetical protein